MDRKIIAISGGEIGREGYDIETLEIDREIIKISNKQNNLMFCLYQQIQMIRRDIVRAYIIIMVKN